MQLTTTIESVQPATPRAVLLQVTPSAPFPFAAGQAALIGQHGLGQRRPYSIAVGPAEAARDGRLEFLIGLSEDGAAGPHLPDLSPGVLVDVEGPLGTFKFPEAPSERRFLFVAGGSGIAPLRAMLHHALMGDPGWRLALVYSARTPDEFAFDAELAALASAERLTYHRTATRHTGPQWIGGQGRISRAMLEAAVEDAETLCFVCGPESLVHEVPRMLHEIGIPSSRVRVEEWAVPAPAREMEEDV
jgi:Na+-transporting NADH:ubiquinone oxidoreductase subunit F